jgi:hypothetical protein
MAPKGRGPGLPTRIPQSQEDEVIAQDRQTGRKAGCCGLAAAGVAKQGKSRSATDNSGRVEEYRPTMEGADGEGHADEVLQVGKLSGRMRSHTCPLAVGGDFSREALGLQ